MMTPRTSINDWKVEFTAPASGFKTVLGREGAAVSVIDFRTAPNSGNRKWVVSE